jgi:hypothetical protein
MEYLKKHTRAHKFRSHLSGPEIESILTMYIPKLKQFPNVNFKNYPEVHDEHSEIMDRIINSAREELKMKFSLKLMKIYKNSHHGDLIIKEYLKDV